MWFNVIHPSSFFLSCVFVRVSPGDGIEKGNRGPATRHHITMLFTRSSSVFSAIMVICCCCVTNLVLLGTICLFGSSGCNRNIALPEGGEWAAGAGRKLAVVVPMYDGDVDESLDAMRLWPTNCSPLNVRYTDLVIYSAEAVNEHALLRGVSKEASVCFRHTKVVHAGLTAEVCLCCILIGWS